MYDTLGTVPKSNRKQPVERGKINTNNLQVYDLPLSWLGTGTSIKVAGLTDNISRNQILKIIL
jgi:hypothetical protein